jgi:signal transduction histidine kinase
MPQSSENTRKPVDVFDEHSAEIGQAKTRLWMTLASIVYIALRWVGLDPIPLPGEKVFYLIPLPTELAIQLAGFFCGYGVFGFAMLTIIRRYPGHFLGRRLVAILGDYSALTYTLIAGEQPTMPFYALILWVAVGNGMRFGRRYLVIAAILAQVSLAAMVIFSPFWLNHIDLIITFSITAIVLPSYAVVLLRHTANARDAAFGAMQAKSRFLAQASHDLRQPVHAIGYYLDILREAERKSERTQMIDRIERALGSVSRLFKSLLDIARLDSGNVEVNPEPIALQPLLLEIIQQNEQAAHWNNVELRFVPTHLIVQADPTLLATMVQNLLSNAIKYAGGSKVLIGVRRRAGTICIEVHDQGIGIAAEHMPHIFDEFYRAHVAGDHDAEGVGLGLSIVNRLAQLSSLTLDVRSTRGVGTIAGIYGIPISTQIAETHQKTLGFPQPQPGFRVILIEDDRDVLEATQQLLSRWGCVVQSFTGPPTDVEPADLIIADFDLGHGARGTEVIAAIRLELGFSIPAILLTGHAESLVREQSVDDGIQILSKPVQPAVLRSVLSAFRIARSSQLEG